MDTHEHLVKERQYVDHGPDVLQDLFDNLIQADLVVAGASPDAIRRLLDYKDSDLKARFGGIQKAWKACQHTGYGEAVRLVARNAYGMDEITPAGLDAACERNRELRRPGERLRLLREIANLDHVQVDDFVWACLPDESGLDFFLYDLSWLEFSSGRVDAKAIHDDVGVEVKDIASLREAMTAIFSKHGPCAVAVKSQHAYRRPLRWRKRTDAETSLPLQKALAGKPLSIEEQMCLGDWSLARGVELAIEYRLPIKIHTGYYNYAGLTRMKVSDFRSADICPLLAEYPAARFVLMHIAYPYHDEILSVAKHYPNVYLDLCWAWCLDPFTAGDFVRRFIHTIPSNKLFAFGGDTCWPNIAVAYAVQMREWFTRALQQEIKDGLLQERQAMVIATRMMHGNQEECFDLARARAANRKSASSSLTTAAV